MNKSNSLFKFIQIGSNHKFPLIFKISNFLKSFIFLKKATKATGHSKIRIEHHDTPPNNFLQNDPEDSQFYKAFQLAKVQGICLGYYVFYHGEQIISVVPYFIMHFHLSSILPDGRLKKALFWFKFKIAFVGNPCVDIGRIDGTISLDILNTVNQNLYKKASLIAYKGFQKNLPLPGFTNAKGLPVAILPIHKNYWLDMGKERQRNFKRKLNKGKSLRIEEASKVNPDLIEKIFNLYLNTHHNSPLQFEKLNSEYFLQTSSLCKYLLFYEEEKLIAFAQIFTKGTHMIAPYMGMNYERNREYGLYFIIALKIIEIGLRDGVTIIDFGVTSYQFKSMLGCEMVPTWNYYRHKNPFANWCLSKMKVLLEPTNKDLGILISTNPTTITQNLQINQYVNGAFSNS